MSKKMINTEILKLVNGCFEMTVKKESDIISDIEYKKYILYFVPKVVDIMIKLPKETASKILYDSIDEAYINHMNNVRDRTNEFVYNRIQEAFINACIKFKILTRRREVKSIYCALITEYNRMAIHKATEKVVDSLLPF